MMVQNFKDNLKNPDAYADAKWKKHQMAQPIQLPKGKKPGKLRPDGSEGKSSKQEAVELLRNLLAEDGE